MITCYYYLVIYHIIYDVLVVVRRQVVENVGSVGLSRNVKGKQQFMLKIMRPWKINEKMSKNITGAIQSSLMVNS